MIILVSVIMEPAKIAIVLARAAELHAKIRSAIIRASTREDAADKEDAMLAEEGSSSDVGKTSEAQTLAAIQTALEALEDQLECLQDLQQQQKIERDAVLTELEENRKFLVKRLREYRGTEWEVLLEAHAFASEPVQEDDLLLPPYSASFHEGMPSVTADNDQSATFQRFSVSLPVSSSVGMPHCQKTDKGIISKQDTKEEVSSLKMFSRFSMGLASLSRQLGQVVGFTAKAAVVSAIVVAIAAFSQLEPRLRRRAAVKAVNSVLEKPYPLVPSQTPYEQEQLCPPGKVLLEQGGISKCFVKERVEVPFEEVINDPNVSYGYG